MVRKAQEFSNLEWLGGSTLAVIIGFSGFLEHIGSQEGHIRSRG